MFKLIINTSEWLRFNCYLWTYFALNSSVSVVDFEHVNVSWVNKLFEPCVQDEQPLLKIVSISYDYAQTR